jgi:hypothetical protein
MPGRAPRGSRDATRHASRNIYRLARGIAEGTRSPLQALTEIVGAAQMCLPRGKPVHWEENAIWRVDLVMELEAETIAAARRLVAEQP